MIVMDSFKFETMTVEDICPSMLMKFYLDVMIYPIFNQIIHLERDYRKNNPQVKSLIHLYDDKSAPPSEDLRINSIYDDEKPINECFMFKMLAKETLIECIYDETINGFRISYVAETEAFEPYNHLLYRTVTSKDNNEYEIMDNIYSIIKLHENV